MNKIIFTVIAIFFLKACSYEPILLNKKYDFQLNILMRLGIRKLIVFLLINLKIKLMAVKFLI